MKEYRISPLPLPPPDGAPFDETFWKAIPALTLEHFRKEGSGHRPEVRFRLGWRTGDGMYGRFDVLDRYVRAAAVHFQEMVCRDSCVEFFVEPAGGRGYLNFEMNCTGVLLCQHVLDPERTPHGLKDARFLTESEVADVRIFHTLAGPVTEEIAGPVRYSVGFFLPFSLFREAAGAAFPHAGSVWRANVYKCGDETSHPHWGSWQPVPELNFHLPSAFGVLRFM